MLINQVSIDASFLGRQKQNIYRIAIQLIGISTDAETVKFDIKYIEFDCFHN